MSEMWTTCFVLSTRLRTVLGPGRCGPRCQNSANAGGALCSAAARKASPSRRYKVPNLASQMRTAFSSMLWNLEHRHSNPGPNAPKLDAFDGRRLTFGISSCRCEVRDLDHLLGPDRLGNETTRSRIEQTSSARLGERWRHIVCRNQAKSAAFMEKEITEFGLA